MKALTRATATAFVGLALFGSGSAPAAVTVANDPVLYWNQLLVQNYLGSPVTTSRGIAIFEVAVHDAVNAAYGNPNKSYTSVATAGGDVRAAATQAAYEVLKVLNPGATGTFETARTNSLALVADGTAKDNGIATGTAIAQAVLASRASDGSGAAPTYAPTNPPVPGRWQPTPPGNLPGAFPQWGGVDPWVIESATQFGAAPPPDINSSEYFAALAEVKALGSASAPRTDDMAESSQFWAQASGGQPWIQAAIDIASGVAGRSSLDNATMLGELGITMADATIALFADKYFYDYWRPVTAIRNAETVPTIAALDDNSWTSYIVTPNHPSYVSGHSAQAAAASTILAEHLGDNVPFEITWTGATYGTITRDWASFEDAAEDAAMSRLWGGIHYRFDNEAGLLMGRSIANFVLAQQTFGAVPEPTTWAMLIVGFGAVGYSLRSRKGQKALQAV